MPKTDTTQAETMTQTRHCIHGRSEKQKCIECNLSNAEVEYYELGKMIAFLRKRIAERKAGK